MPKRSPGVRPVSPVRIFRLIPALALAMMLVLASPAAYALEGYPDNFNPLLVMSDFNWRNSTSMSQAEIQAFLASKSSVLTDYSCPTTGYEGADGAVRSASQIIAEAAQYWNVNPMLILSTLEKEQSLITQTWHTGKDIDPTSTHGHSTSYHITYAMGAGVYTGSPDYNPGFADQVWTGTMKLGQTTGAYAWWPGKSKTVWSYVHGAYIGIEPLNQPTWNFYTYTPYYPQYSIWRIYNQWFGDPRIDAVDGRVNRFYNKKNGTHFYTASPSEAQRVARDLTATYVFEGAAYSLDTTSGANGQPLFRFYRPSNGTHFYTVSTQERDTVIGTLSKTYRYEGPAYMVSIDPQGRTPVYRFYNRQGGSHFYTIDAAERDAINATLGWKYTYEGIAYYVALAR